jgi:hypothetical protein
MAGVQQQKKRQSEVLMDAVSGLIEDGDNIMNACLEWFLLTRCYNSFDFIAALQV